MCSLDIQHHSREDLIAQFSIEFIQKVLGPQCTYSHAQVIRCILLRNTMSGRIVRHMQQQHAMSGMARLTDYTRDVEFHYMKERNRWAYLQTQSAYQDLYDLLFLFACGHTTSWRAQGYNADAYDIASEAFIHCGRRLRRYPFDITLDCWLDRHTHQCAAQLYCFNRHSNISLSGDDTSDWLLASSTQCNDALRDQLIDLDNGIAKLDKNNRNILKMWRNGYSLQETSRALKMTEKAVSNRRGRIREKLLKLIDDPYPEKTT